METGHKYLAEQKALTDDELQRLEPYISGLSEDIAAHYGGRTLRTITGRLIVSKNNVAMIVGGSTAEAELVQSAALRAVGDIGQLRSSLLVVPAAEIDYETIQQYPYVLPVAAELDAWGPKLEWFICDVMTITNEGSYDSIMERLVAANNYLRFGGEEPVPLPKQPAISRQLGQVAGSNTGLTA